jgi:hypothetical protein
MDYPRKRRRRWLWWLAGLLAFWFVGIPTVQALSIRYRVLSAVLAAQSVRLEEFGDDGSILTAAELGPIQREAIDWAMPPLPQLGVPGLYALCFDPHHRIVARDSAGHEFVFKVCFTCGQVQANHGLIRMIPFLWYFPLRWLFTLHNVRVRDSGEYSETMFRHLKADRGR